MPDDNGMDAPPPDRDMSMRAAVVGVGVTDFGADYRASRQDPTRTPASVGAMAATAFERAIADSGIDRREVDGLSVTFLYGGPEPGAFSRDVGIQPDFLLGSSGVVPVAPACAALATGRCNTIALVYAVNPRSIGRRYGGETYLGTGRDSYYYYHPWGWSSQAAHWALIQQRYMSLYKVADSDLGSVSITLRANAARNDNAIMQTPLTIDDYLSSRYIVRPVRLLDLCLVNDGGVCLILRRADRCHDLPHAPVFIAGWGMAAGASSKMEHMVVGRLATECEAAVGEACTMAGTTISEVQHVQAYDPSSIHLMNQLEGYGFVESGTGVAFCKEGHMDLTGSLPVNTNGGLMSEAYMHGWNNIVESVRQLRHECGDRQVPGVEQSLFSFATTDAAHPIILRRDQDSK
jgi:acetyl-CoA acetyltransferase